jgi:hypothetical protein
VGCDTVYCLYRAIGRIPGYVDLPCQLTHLESARRDLMQVAEESKLKTETALVCDPVRAARRDV